MKASVIGGVMLILSIFFLPQIVSAVGVGVSPASLNYEKLLRGGFAEKTVTINVGTEQEVEIEVIPRGDIADWLNFSSKKYSISKNNPVRLGIEVRPPEDIPNGFYTGIIRIKTSGLGSGEENQATGIITASVDVVTVVEVTDIEIIECKAGGFQATSVEEGEDIKFKVNIQNSGNIRLNPTISFEIWDQDQEEILISDEINTKDILPTIEEEISFEVRSEELELGQYWARVNAQECFSSDVLTFDVLEEGSLRAVGILKKILNRQTIEVGETTPIIAIFENVGEKSIDAQFKGQITLGEKIVKVIESDVLEVDPGNLINLTMFFTPEEKGRHVVNGRVLYENKITYDSSSIIEVLSKDKWKLTLNFAITLILIILGASLLWIIRKEKNKYLEEIRKIKGRKI